MEGEPHFINPDILGKEIPQEEIFEKAIPEQISLSEALSTFMAEINTTKRAMVAAILLDYPDGIDHSTLRKELKERVEYEEGAEVVNDENSFKDFLRVFSVNSKIIKKNTYIKEETRSLTNFYFIAPVYQKALNIYLEKFLNFSDSYQINFENFLNRFPGESVDKNNFPTRLVVANFIYKQIQLRGLPAVITQKSIEKDCQISPGTTERILEPFQKMNLGEYQQYGSRPHVFFQLTNDGEVFAQSLEEEPKKIPEAILRILLQVREEDASKALSYQGIIARLKKFPKWSNLSVEEEERLYKSLQGFRLPKLINSYDPPIVRSIEQSTCFVVTEDNDLRALEDIVTWINKVSTEEYSDNGTMQEDSFYKNLKEKKNVMRAGQMLLRSETGNPRAKLETEKSYMNKIVSYLEVKSLPVTRKELYTHLDISEQYISRILRHMQQQWGIIRIDAGGREDYWKLPDEVEKLQIRMIRAFTENGTIFKIESNDKITMKLASDEDYQETYEEFQGFNEYTLKKTKERKEKDLQDPHVPVIELAYTEGKKSVNFTYLYYFITKDFFLLDQHNKRMLPSETKMLKRCYSWLNYFLYQEYSRLRQEDPSLPHDFPVSVEQLLERIVQEDMYDAVTPSLVVPPSRGNNLVDKSTNRESISIVDITLIPDREKDFESDFFQNGESIFRRNMVESLDPILFVSDSLEPDGKEGKLILSDQEKEILILKGNGFTNFQISQIVKKNSISYELHNMCEGNAASNVFNLITRALSERVISPGAFIRDEQYAKVIDYVFARVDIQTYNLLESIIRLQTVSINELSENLGFSTSFIIDLLLDLKDSLSTSNTLHIAVIYAAYQMIDRIPEDEELDERITLDHREIELLKLKGQGISTSKMAEMFQMDEQSIKNIFSRVRSKNFTNDNLSLIMRCFAQNIISPDFFLNQSEKSEDELGYIFHNLSSDEVRLLDTMLSLGTTRFKRLSKEIKSSEVELQTIMNKLGRHLKTRSALQSVVLYAAYKLKNRS